MTSPIRNWRRFLPYIGGIAALLLFAAALVILHSHAQAYRPSEVRRALRTLQAWQPFAALGLAAASYLLLTLYDVLALRHIGRTLPYRRVALASFTGYAFSHALGFGSLIGPSIRYRIYTPMGLTAGEVAETSAFVIVTFMTGLVAVFPLVALLDPSSLETLGISRPAGIAIGTLGLLLMAGYVGLGWWIERPIRLFGYPLHLPRPRTAVAQIALSVADLSLVAAVLYACLPHASAVGYPHVLAVYVLAFVAGLISHVPGGLGVFDAVVVVGLSARLPADQILAGLLAFRVVYQLVPLVGAGVLFGAVEALAARRLFAQAVENISIWVGAVGPTVLAGCTFTGGVVLLFSNAMPVSERPPAAGRDGAAAHRDRDIAFHGQHRRRVTAAVRVRRAAAVAVGLGALGGAALRRGCVADAKGLRMGRGHRARAAPPRLAARATGVPPLELTTFSAVRIWLVCRDRRCAHHRVLARLVFVQAPRRRGMVAFHALR